MLERIWTKSDILLQLPMTAEHLRATDMKTVELNGFITTKKAAELLGCSERRIRQLLDEGKIRGVKLNVRFWLVEQASLRPFLEPLTRGRPRSRRKLR